MNCHACGTEISDADQHCTNCGAVNPACPAFLPKQIDGTPAVEPTPVTETVVTEVPVTEVPATETPS